MNNYKNQLMNKLGFSDDCVLEEKKEVVEIIDYTNIADILGDGSCVVYCNFFNNTDDLLGSSKFTPKNGTVYVDEDDGNTYIKGGANYNTYVRFEKCPIDLFNSKSVAFSFFGKVYNNSNEAYFICSGNNSSLSGGGTVSIRSYKIGVWKGTDIYFDKNYNDGETHHFIVSVLDGVVNVYVDGVLSASDNRNIICNGYTSYNIYSLLQHPYTINHSGSKSYTEISKLRVFNRGLTEDECIKLYKREKGVQ